MAKIYVKDYDTTVNFPDTMGNDEIKAVLANKFPPKAKKVEEPSIMSDIGTAISNIPSSGYKVGKDILSALTSPMKTADTMAEVIAGGIIKALPESAKKPKYRGKKTPPEQAAEATGKYFKNRYGGKKNIRKTAINDPAGLFLDLSAVLTGTGAGVKAAGLPSVGRGISKVGKAIDPINVAAKGVSLATTGASKIAGGVGKHVLGVSTGKGPANIEVASRGGKAFAKELRGSTPGSEVVSNVNEALNVFKGQRSAQYRERLVQFKNAAKEVDMTPINKKFSKELNSFGYQLDETGQLKKFGRTKLNKSDVEELNKVAEALNEFNDPSLGKTTTADLDLLKQRLDDLYTPSSRIRALVTDIKHTVKQKIVEQVPEYATMTGDYEKMSNLIKQMEGALSLGEKKSVDTALKKLTTTLREEPEFRRSLIQKLDEMTGVNIEEQIAGYSMRDYTPSGLWAKGIGSVWVAKLFSTLDPTFGALLLSASPRVVGEFANVLGKGRKAAKFIGREAEALARKTGALNPTFRQLPFQAGRIEEEVQESRSNRLQNKFRDVRIAN